MLSSSRAHRLARIAVPLLAAAAAIGLVLAPLLAARAIHSAAARRGLAASFDRPRFGLGPSILLTRFVLTRRLSGDTLMRADSLQLAASPLSLLLLSPRVSLVRLAHARVTLRSAQAADPDTLAPESAPGEDDRDRRERGAARRARAGRESPREDRSSRVRATAGELVRLALIPARGLPRLDLADVTVVRAGGGDTLGLRIDRLRLAPRAGGARLVARGEFRFEHEVPVEGRLEYARDDRLTGNWRLGIPGAPRGRGGEPEVWPLELAVDARLHQDRHGGRVELREPSTLRVGSLPLRLAGTLERAGPALHFTLAADSLTSDGLQRSLPPPVLGPLMEVSTRGRWDYRLGLDLDLARPDSVDFHADVIAHGLSLDPARTRLGLFGLDQPFVAAIHLPRDRVVFRDLSPANPHFRPLAAMDSVLAYAVVTNEDGGFFRHRGFNSESVKGAIADNIRAAAFRRGAGTITMQLARNLWLGHARTLSRKTQEVMLAWVIEHLTGLTKQRLLEIYLNVIEWGPDIHGADEAAHFYFGHDAGQLSVDEALFLTILVPSPSHWRWRLDDAGALRPFARAQMHFIGRAMIAKGWLPEGALPAADDLRIEVRGPARDLLLPPAPPDTTGVSRLDLGSGAVSVSPRVLPLPDPPSPDRARARERMVPAW